jgi:putative ABC transport system permease protein
MNPLMEMRLAIRAVRREPGIAMMAVLAFALGIGLPAAMFSLTRSIATRGLPVEEGDRIMYLERRPEGGRGEGMGSAPRDFMAWREQQSTFEQLAAYTTVTAAVRIDEGAERFEAAYVTANTWDMLRVAPTMGRSFREGDDLIGAEPVAMISHRMWAARFSSDPGILGRVIHVEGSPHTIIGVVPEGMQFPIGQDLWVPLVLAADAAQAGSPTLGVWGRLAQVVSQDEAIAQFAVIASRTAQMFPETNEAIGVTVKQFTIHHLGETPMTQMRVITAAVLLVLIVACTNVANLLLARAVHRIRDLAVRTALGASRLRIVMQLLMESTVMAVMGGVLGIGVASAAMGALRYWLSGDRMPFWVDMRLDNETLLYTFALTIVAGLIAGALPAIKAIVKDVHSVLKDEARGSSAMNIGRLMQGLIVVEIALSMGLLIATGLMIQSVRNVRDVRFGFDTATTITAQLGLPEAYDTDERSRFITRIETRMEGDPAISSFTVTSNAPVTRAGATRLAVEGRTYANNNAMPIVRRVTASPSFFGTFGASLTAGREFGPGDIAGSEPVVIINRQVAERYFPGEDPIGRRIRLGGENATDDWRTIVGVSPDLWAAGLDNSPDINPPAAYIPVMQSPPRTLTLAVITAAPAAQVASSIRDAVSAIDPEVPVYDVKTMGEVIEDNSWFFAFGAAVIGACGLSALILAAIGLYGVIAFSVGRRTREIGIRIAVGATPQRILQLVMWRGGRQVIIGSVFGFALAYLLGSGVSTLLFMVEPNSPPVYAVFGSLLIAITVVATLIPARRASRVDPLSALRSE